MKLAVPMERRANEARVAATPDTVKRLKGLGIDVVVETGAGTGTSIPDQAFVDAGATIAPDEAGGARRCRHRVQGRPALTADEGGPDELAMMKSGALVAALFDPYRNRPLVEACAARGIQAAAMELMPRIHAGAEHGRAVLAANLAGYKAVIDAAEEFGRAFPMMMTAAGTVPPARVMIFGVGVAGPAGDRDGAAPRCGGFGDRRAAGDQGAGREPSAAPS